MLVYAGLLGACASAVYVNSRQRKITARLFGGRHTRILCLVRAGGDRLWTRGYITLESGSWSWEPGKRQQNPVALPPDLAQRQVRPLSRADGTRLNHRFVVIECTSAEGDVHIAALPGQVEHLCMVLGRQTRPVDAEDPRP